MKAAFLTGPGCFEIRDVSKPEIRRPNDVLIRIDFTGICGSDLHYFRTGFIGNQVIDEPFVVGHESVGTVMETGDAVTRLKSGDRVAVEPAVSCGSCDQCLAGRPHTCRRLSFLGCPGQMHGSLTEMLVMPESNCMRLPDMLPLLPAVFVEPMSIALYAWQFVNAAEIKRIAILGSGPIGLSVQMIAREKGDVKSYMTDKHPHRLEAAKALGALPLALSGGYENNGFECDAVFECCGQPEAVRQAVELLKPGGHLVMVGIPEVREFLINPHDFRRKEITLHNVRRQNGCVGEAVAFCARHPDIFTGLVTHTFTLPQVQEAFTLAEAYADGVLKAVLVPG